MSLSNLANSPLKVSATIQTPPFTQYLSLAGDANSQRRSILDHVKNYQAFWPYRYHAITKSDVEEGGAAAGEIDQEGTGEQFSRPRRLHSD